MRKLSGSGVPPEALAIWHKPRREKYHRGNSSAGVRRVALLGANAADVDVTASKSGKLWANHWPRPLTHDGFVDPLGRIHRQAALSRLDDDQIERLRAGRYRIEPIRNVLDVAGLVGVTLCFEVKPTPGADLTHVSFWRAVAVDIRDSGAHALIMCQPHGRGELPIGIRILAAAHAAGLWTMLQTRGRVRSSWWQHLDAVKGRRSWTNPGRPAHVRRLGGGFADATRYGATAGSSRARVKLTNAAIRRAARRGITR